jgi:alpha-beta hydrolase superfamily lysophospholipase
MVSYSHLTFTDTKKTKITLHQWLPKSPPEQLILICHGISEHGARYAPVANYLAETNKAVFAIDHRGHGLTGKDTGLGVIGEQDSYHSIIRNINDAKAFILNKYPNIPLIILGHSMGSFLAQAAVQEDPQNVSGLILSGTSIEPSLLLTVGKTLSKFLGSLFGMTSPSALLKLMVFTPYILAFIPFRTSKDWICSVDEVVDDYIADPLCNFTPTFQLFYALFDVLNTIYKKERLTLIPKELPILLFSGEKDPLAKGGSALKRVVKKYNETGHKNIQLIMYPKGRHEMLLECNKEKVFSDISAWLGSI